MMENKILLKRNLIWKQVPLNNRYFYIEQDNKFIYLRVNNFPDEPLFTIINDLDILDIEDRPEHWDLEGF